TLTSLKWLSLLTKIYPFFYNRQENERKLNIIMYTIKLVALISLLFIHIQLSATIITIAALFSAYKFFDDRIYIIQFLYCEIIISLLIIHYILTEIIITISALFSSYQFFADRIYFSQFFKWEIMIEKEEQRLQRIYRFIQMFVDVPHIKTRIRRLKWLDRPLNWFSQHYPTAPYYYILRTMTRNSEYSLLILRVTIIGAILLAVTESFAT